MSIILNGKHYEVPGVTTISYEETSEFQSAIHKRSRSTWVRGIVLHTNRGMVPETVRPGGKDAKRDLALADYQDSSERVAGWDYSADFDGSIAVSNDPYEYATYHAGHMNDYSVGIEMNQLRSSPYALYENELNQMVLFLDFLTNRLGIQRQILWDKENDCPIKGVIERLENERYYPWYCGLYGHRNCSSNKGPGDPGNPIFYKLKEAGYELFDVRDWEDVKVWKERQRKLGNNNPDGIPGPATRKAMIDHGHPYGLYVKRPMDDILREYHDDAFNDVSKTNIHIPET